MGEGGLDKHQLAGLDYRERGFSRPVEFERTGDRFLAILRYETVRISTDPHPAQDAALLAPLERAIGADLEVVGIDVQHILYWEALDETAAEVRRFLR